MTLPSSITLSSNFSSNLHYLDKVSDLSCRENLLNMDSAKPHGGPIVAVGTNLSWYVPPPIPVEPGKEFYLTAPRSSLSLFSLGGKPWQPPRQLSLPFVSRDEVQPWTPQEVEENVTYVMSLYGEYLRRQAAEGQFVHPTKWTDLFWFFDSFDIWKNGPMNLLNVVTRVCAIVCGDETAAKARKRIIERFVDGWVADKVNHSRLMSWKGDCEPLFLLGADEAFACRFLFDVERHFVSDLLLHRYLSFAVPIVRRVMAVDGVPSLGDIDGRVAATGTISSSSVMADLGGHPPFSTWESTWSAPYPGQAITVPVANTSTRPTTSVTGTTTRAGSSDAGAEKINGTCGENQWTRADEDRLLRQGQDTAEPVSDLGRDGDSIVRRGLEGPGTAHSLASEWSRAMDILGTMTTYEAHITAMIRAPVLSASGHMNKSDGKERAASYGSGSSDANSSSRVAYNGSAYGYTANSWATKGYTTAGGYAVSMDVSSLTGVCHGNAGAFDAKNHDGRYGTSRRASNSNRESSNGGRGGSASGTATGGFRGGRGGKRGRGRGGKQRTTSVPFE